MKKILIAVGISLFILSCSSVETVVTPNSNNANQVNSNQSNAAKQEALSPEGEFFESLTSDSNYFDVVKLIGTPDSKTDTLNNFLVLKLVPALFGSGYYLHVHTLSSN